MQANSSQQQAVLLRETAPVSELADQAISAVVDGYVDPVTAYANICRMEAAIKAFKENAQVREITLSELAKYGKSHQFGDCRMEECEAGVKYDFSQSGCSRLAEMYETKKAIEADIKELESTLKVLPSSGMADTETGEVWFPPARSSKTIIKTTFKKQ